MLIELIEYIYNICCFHRFLCLKIIYDLSEEEVNDIYDNDYYDNSQKLYSVDHIENIL